MQNYKYRPVSSRLRGRSAPRQQRRGPKKDYIDPARFVQSAKKIAEEAYTPSRVFADFPLQPLILENLKQMGYDSPTTIQDQTIQAGIDGKDIVGIADTGTGKTAAFGIPLLNQLIKDRTTQALILAPTRELAEQIEGQCRLIARGSGLDGALLIGGVSMGPQLRDLRFNPRIIIGTPGRIKDHTERGSLRLGRCNIVVLDEVDRMLDMGFIIDIRYILSLTASHKQSYYFSATLDDRVKGIIESFSVNPFHVSVKSGHTSENVEQKVVNFSSANDKIDKLHDILIQADAAKTLVFDDTHRSVDRLTKELELRGFRADSIHGGKSQAQRQRVLSKFRDNHIKVLVATDVAARGLDITDITHVINYSTPQTYNDYVHRIGRTGRAGKTGQALTFIEK